MGASPVPCSSALEVASEKSARAKSCPSLSLVQPCSLAHFLSSQGHVLVLPCPLGVTHTSTHAKFVSQVTELPQADGKPRRSR